MVRPDRRCQVVDAGPDSATDGYGEQVTTTVSHGKTSPYDCLAWAAIIFSTTVQDTRRRRAAGQAGGPERAQRSADRRARSCPTSTRWARARPSRICSSKSGVMTDGRYNVAGGHRRGRRRHSHLPTPRRSRWSATLLCAGSVRRDGADDDSAGMPADSFRRRQRTIPPMVEPTLRRAYIVQTQLVLQTSPAAASRSRKWPACRADAHLSVPGLSRHGELEDRLPDLPGRAGRPWMARN